MGKRKLLKESQNKTSKELAKERLEIRRLQFKAEKLDFKILIIKKNFYQPMRVIEKRNQRRRLDLLIKMVREIKQRIENIYEQEQQRKLGLLIKKVMGI